ncbi:hypothetical protein [Nocardia sp. R6R-6]|uniref:hypothetical protein n=1 Tax=Nocardia sp. R6R-6 TaxID=3459303 RepID=UPI00403DE49E
MVYWHEVIEYEVTVRPALLRAAPASPGGGVAPAVHVLDEPRGEVAFCALTVRTPCVMSESIDVN